MCCATYFVVYCCRWEALVVGGALGGIHKSLDECKLVILTRARFFLAADALKVLDVLFQACVDNT
jgi:hypothetical protein